MVPAQPRRSLLGCTSAVLCAAALAIAPRAAVAQNACGVLSASDVGTMLGPGPTSKELGMGRMCNWTSSRDHRELQVSLGSLDSLTRKTFDDLYAHPGRGPMGESRREEGLGDRAISFTLPHGVNFEVVKGGRMLLLVYANRGVAPTSREHDALRALAQKIVRQM